MVYKEPTTSVFVAAVQRYLDRVKQLHNPCQAISKEGIERLHMWFDQVHKLRRHCLAGR